MLRSSRTTRNAPPQQHEAATNVVPQPAPPVDMAINYAGVSTHSSHHDANVADDDYDQALSDEELNFHNGFQSSTANPHASVSDNNDARNEHDGESSAVGREPRASTTAPSQMELMMSQMMGMFSEMRQNMRDNEVAVGRELATLREQIRQQERRTAAVTVPRADAACAAIPNPSRTWPTASNVNASSSMTRPNAYAAATTSAYHPFMATADTSSSMPRPNAYAATSASAYHTRMPTVAERTQPAANAYSPPDVATNGRLVVLTQQEYSRIISQEARSNCDNAAQSSSDRAANRTTTIPSATGASTTSFAPNIARAGLMDHRRLYELPVFSGKPEEWPLFYHAFVNSTNAYAYTDLENHMRLQKALIGEAKAVVQRILIHPRHVGQVMTTLAKNFGRPEILLRSQLQAARELPNVTEDRLDELGAFSTSVLNLATFLDTDETQQYLANPALLDELVVKLPMSRRLDWACVAKRILPYPTVMDFAMWVDELADMVSLVLNQPSKEQHHKSNHRFKKVGNAAPFVGMALDNSLASCTICEKPHKTRDCRKLLQMSVEQRWKEIVGHSVCFCCLGVGHILINCPEKRSCGVDGCTRFHHVLLHTNQSQLDRVTQRTGGFGSQKSGGSGQNGGNAQQSGSSGQYCRGGIRDGTSQQGGGQRPAAINNTTIANGKPQPSVLSCHEACDSSPLLFRVVPVELHNQDRSIRTYALLDEGSSVTLMDATLADQLGLDGPQSDLNLKWIGSQKTTQKSATVSLEVSGLHGSERYPITVRTVRRLALPAQTVNAKRLKEAFIHLRDVSFDSFECAIPKLLIGLDNHHLGVPISMAIGSNAGEIVAAKTRLGWCVYGYDQQRSSPSAVVLHVNTQEYSKYQELDELVRSYIATEDFGAKTTNKPIESDKIVRARELLAATTRRVGERFETGLLWRTDEEKLPDSHDMALRRLCSIEAKMRRNADYAAQYREQIAGYLQKGYARQLTIKEANERGPHTWYLPHFAVTNPNKPGKFRLVFDAAAVVRGQSLNSALLSGPDENVPLTRLLFRFRIGLVGVCADIREMFHQVRIRAEDQQSQRFLWRNGDHTRAPEEYVMQVMTFGSTCSPASAQFVKNLNAEQHRVNHPEAADAIQNGHYVDDYVVSFSSPEEAVRISKDVVNVHKAGGFVLRGFLSNSQAVMSALEADTGGGQTVRMEHRETPDKILGMYWKTSDDTFTFQTKFSRVDPDVMAGRRRPTKREVLSTIMSVFDPFGLLADFLLTAKILLQDLWRVGTTWDQQVPEDVDERWQSWRSRIEQTRECRVPRCYAANIKTTTDLQLHVFCDASEAAFAAVAYWRVAGDDGTTLNFVAGKTKCAPLKMLSIPRLELQAAMLATRLLHEIRTCHDLNVKSVTMWTDSQTVLQWLRSEARRYKPFVAVRVAEISEAVDVSRWRWCPTALNVADDATRVKTNPDFDPESRWLRGPAWLRDAEDSWPVQSATKATDTHPEEIRRKFLGLVSSCSFIERFSRFVRLQRVTSWMRRFATNTRARSNNVSKMTGELTTTEIDAATRVLCRIAQQDAYPVEYATVLAGRSVSASNELFKLNLYVDDDGVLRLHGRTDAASQEHMPADTKRPILLPRRHHLTRLIVQHEHEKLAHQFEDATAVAVRRSFWVPQLRVLVRSVRRQCTSCRIRTARPSPQPFGQLPKDRLTPYVRPFFNTGLDYFGPVEVTIGRRREKRWVAIFTCLSVRAVHLEIAADLSTDSCLTCIRNLANLRGPPARIRCDNGTNFVGARNELAREVNFFDSQAMQRELSTQNIEWVFNCPGNPEAGGAWERLVQSVKRVLSVTLKEVAPRVETLRSLLLEAANILNARPLTHLPVEADEPDPITPNHFLIGNMNATTAPIPAEQEPLPTRRQWAIVQELVRRFWSRWLTDYLPELTRRSRHYINTPALKEGGLVLICETNQPRGSWIRGRIVKTIAGTDGIVRTAEVQTVNGILRRPATRLAVLDVEHAVP